MKKIILLSIIVGLFSCSEKYLKVSADDMVSISPASKQMSSSHKVKSEYTHLSALEIVKQTTEIQLKYNGITYGRSFAKEQRDTVSPTPKLLMWATDVISLDGQYVPDFVEATDVIFLHYDLDTYWIKDTIAYISDSTLRVAEKAIKKAYAEADYELMYSTFNTAYTFTPVTGKEWLELKNK